MEIISVAVAFTSGEMASEIIASIDDHPFLDLCGIARSIPDLFRLLERFRPAALVISPLLLEELDPSSLEPGQAGRLSAPVSFLITHPGMHWDEVELAGMLRLPLRLGGLIAADAQGGGDLFQVIRDRMETHCGGETGCAHELKRAGGQKERSGLYTVMGSKGGVGNTLLTCALAAAMSSSGRRVLLMEMDHVLSQLLYLKPHGGGKALLDLFPLAEEISWDLIKVSVHRHAAGFHLLPYGRENDGGATVEARLPESLMRNLLFLFDVVVQDFPASLRREFIPLLRHNPTVLLVSLPDTLSATCARSTAAFLRRTGLDQDHLHLVVNRCGPHHALSPGELARAVGMDLLAALPDDTRSGLDFAELGELPCGDSPLGKAVAAMAAVFGCGGDTAVKTPTTQLFRRLRGRSIATT
ncbi:MAG: hypothetical protein C4536_00500 [Actinobacteria bacterium]|jgi:MinD-like ATPase involved in chromosome partitioning or flagellar assembly|nr:MAG: hypothetical protein C4536_00500 [Actinomycetota bacterium]